jgi:hypothetical protein
VPPAIPIKQLVASPDYTRFVAELKVRVESARLAAARSVNRELVALYWEIGGAIVEKQTALGWGDAVVEMVAADLRRAFPGMRGFSAANVWQMRQLHLVCSNEAILAQAAREFEHPTLRQEGASFLGQVVPKNQVVEAASGGNPILAQAVRELAAAVPWGHHVLLLGRVKSPPELFYYAHRKTGNLCPKRMRRAPWIRPVLEMKVLKTKVYVNRHSMQPREYGPAATGKRNRIFVTTGSDLLYFISLVYTEHGLALATAFEPDGQWLRQTLKSHGTSLLGPPF